jgi:hypothetical protein
MVTVGGPQSVLLEAADESVSGAAHLASHPLRALSSVFNSAVHLTPAGNATKSPQTLVWGTNFCKFS